MSLNSQYLNSVCVVLNKEYNATNQDYQYGLILGYMFSGGGNILFDFDYQDVSGYIKVPTGKSLRECFFTDFISANTVNIEYICEEKMLFFNEELSTDLLFAGVAIKQESESYKEIDKDKLEWIEKKTASFQLGFVHGILSSLSQTQEGHIYRFYDKKEIYITYCFDVIKKYISESKVHLNKIGTTNVFCLSVEMSCKQMSKFIINVED